MKLYSIQARLLSPVVVKRERQSQRSDGVDHLSGSLLRGAVAQAWLQMFGEPGDEFRRLFLEDSCRFGPLDPAPSAIPLSAATCKREGGFQADGRHGMADQLWSRIARALTGSPRPDEPLHCRVADCRADLKGETGFWDPDTRKGVRKPRRQLAVHVGIDRTTHTAAEAIFYSLDGLSPRADNEEEDNTEGLLRGLIEAEPSTWEALTGFLSTIGGEVRAGHGRTRGNGRVRLEPQGEVPASAPDLDRWSRELIDYLQLMGGTIDGLDPSRAFFFALSLPTGAVLVDDLLRYTLDPAAMVPWLPRLPRPEDTRLLTRPGKPYAGGELWCVSAISRHDRVRGWNAAHGLPRQDEWAVSRGAVYAYLFQGDGSAQRQLQAGLDGLREQGIGLRRNEGFGRVTVSDTFHQLFKEQEIYVEPQ